MSKKNNPCVTVGPGGRCLSRFGPGKRLRWMALGLASIICALGQVTLGQTDSDRAQIAKLMSDLCGHVVAADALLDPRLADSQREQYLSYFKDPSYQLTLVREGDTQLEPGSAATVPVRVHFKNATSEVDTDASANFIKREGVWYFADFKFVGFLKIIVIVVIVSAIGGTGYAAGVLMLKRKLQREGRLQGINLLKIFVPVFWPNLFSTKA